MREANIPSHVDSLGPNGKLLVADEARTAELRASGRAGGARAAGPGLVEGVTTDSMMGVREKDGAEDAGGGKV